MTLHSTPRQRSLADRLRNLADEYDRTKGDEAQLIYEAAEALSTRSEKQAFDAVQLSKARFYRDSKEPIGILARAILRANGEMK